MKTNKGITLIALIITVIVMLILAGIVITLAVGDDGIINRGNEANAAMEKKEIEETIQTSYYYDVKNPGNLEYDETEKSILSNLTKAGYLNVNCEGTGTGTNKTFPMTVTATGKTGTHKFDVYSNGDIKEYVELEITVSEPIVEDINGVQKTESESAEISEKLYIKFTANMNEGEITSVTINSAPVEFQDGQYIYEITENGNYSFEITGSNSIRTITKNLIVEINQYKTTVEIEHNDDYYIYATGRINKLSEDGISALNNLKGKDVILRIPEKNSNGINITKIYEKAFSEVSAINNLNSLSIEMPFVEEIGAQAFKNCTSLKSIELDKATSIGTWCFEGCSNLAEIKMPNLTALPQDAFKNCTSLKSVELDSVETIGRTSFSGCSGLTEIELSTVTSIGQEAFKNCTSLKSIKFQNAAKINQQAFYGCSNLTEVILPNVTGVGKYAFQNCTKLESIALENLTSAETYSFWNCTSLKEIDIPKVTTIETGTFKDCGNLTTVTGTFETINPNAFENCKSLTNINLASVKSIGDYAFQKAGLTSAKMDNVLTIGSSAFKYCTNLEEVTFPKVQSIGTNAFMQCNALKIINIPSSLETLGSKVFDGQYLKTINISGFTTKPDGWSSSWLSNSNLSKITWGN